MHIHHALRVRIPEVALVRKSEVDLGLVERVGHLVWEHTRRQTRYDLLHVVKIRGVEHVVVDEGVIAQEGELMGRP